MNSTFFTRLLVGGLQIALFTLALFLCLPYIPSDEGSTPKNTLAIVLLATFAFSVSRALAVLSTSQRRERAMNWVVYALEVVAFGSFVFGLNEIQGLLWNLR